MRCYGGQDDHQTLPVPGPPSLVHWCFSTITTTIIIILIPFLDEYQVCKDGVKVVVQSLNALIWSKV